MADTPEQIKEHSEDYKEDAWEDYTAGELGMFAHLLRKRATHRTNEKKAEKDRYDADNYEAMLRAKLKN